MRILIVDDEPGICILFKAYLERYGECDLVFDGDEAIDAFKQAHGHTAPYDLICLDIMMPRMSGREVLNEIRKIEKSMDIHGLDGVKVIMITAMEDSKTIIGSFSDQCEAYLKKPIKKQELIGAIREIGLLEMQNPNKIMSLLQKT